MLRIDLAYMRKLRGNCGLVQRFSVARPTFSQIKGRQAEKESPISAGPLYMHTRVGYMAYMHVCEMAKSGEKW